MGNFRCFVFFVQYYDDRFNLQILFAYFSHSPLQKARVFFFERVMKGTAQSHNFCLLPTPIHFTLYRFVLLRTSYFSANFSGKRKKVPPFQAALYVRILIYCLLWYLIKFFPKKSFSQGKGGSGSSEVNPKVRHFWRCIS